ncbi:MAG: hypothetical protein F6K65_30450, partial [Moorea sp. SIO3C2]|nr:hypothetical protein [Moorena sp. SIO3C2]
MNIFDGLIADNLPFAIAEAVLASGAVLAIASKFASKILDQANIGLYAKLTSRVYRAIDQTIDLGLPRKSKAQFRLNIPTS